MSHTRTAGLLAMFDSAEALSAAAARARDAGLTRLDAFTPFPVDGLDETLGFSGADMRWWVLAGGILGGIAGFSVQWWTAVVDYPLDIGGRPIFAWPSFMLVTFEMSVLFGALGGFAGLLIRSGLPRLHHPVFEADCFQLASRDRFFLYVKADDPRYDRAWIETLLATMHPMRITEVPR